MINLMQLQGLNTNPNIRIQNLVFHNKASEYYVCVTFQHEDFHWEGWIPYYYRRTGLAIEKEEELIQYLDSVYPLFHPDAIRTWVEEETRLWNEQNGEMEKTKVFFDKLLNLGWSSVTYDLPANRNWARRIQAIKEMGYSLTTDLKRKVRGRNETDTHVRLVPIPRGFNTGYESFSDAFRARALAVLAYTNVYELSTANRKGLLPDHKFPEIRWDENTRVENPDDMSVAEIKNKFQLLDNQRNQQKREVCRRCFQTNKRGIIYGVNYFYEGDENWPSNAPKVGKFAEAGCVGCGWYDIEAWRNSLNTRLNTPPIVPPTEEYWQ